VLRDTPITELVTAILYWLVFSQTCLKTMRAGPLAAVVRMLRVQDLRLQQQAARFCTACNLPSASSEWIRTADH
jgi:hypothetical protein